MATSGDDGVIISGTVNAPDIRIRKSGVTGNYLGGSIHASEMTHDEFQNLFENVRGPESATGSIRFACVYLYNANVDYPLRNAVLYFDFDTTSGSDKAFYGLDPTAGVNQTAQTIASRYTEPLGVNWLHATQRQDQFALVIPFDIPPLGYIPLWFKVELQPGAGQEPRNEFRFGFDWSRTDSVIPETFGICFAGNCGCNNKFFPQSVVNMESRVPQAVYFAGGLSESGSASCFLDIIRTLIPKSKVAFGAIDGYDPENNALVDAYKNAFGYDSTINGFQIFNVFVILMNTNRTLGTGSTQYAIVENYLIQARSNPEINWIIVVGYDQMWSPIMDDGLDNDNRELRDNFAPLFQKYAVHLYISASTPNYQRTGLIAIDEEALGSGGSTKEPLDHEVDEDPNYIFRDNDVGFRNDSGIYHTMHINIGTGGMFDLKELLEEEEGEDPVEQPEFVRQTIGDTFGYLFLEFSENGQKIDGRFYSYRDTSKDNFSMKTDSSIP